MYGAVVYYKGFQDGLCRTVGSQVSCPRQDLLVCEGLMLAIVLVLQWVLASSGLASARR